MRRRTWGDPTQREVRETIATLAELAGKHPAMQDTPARARPVQHERAAARALVTRARREWWGTYLVHPESATASRSEGRANQQAGQQQGIPDYFLFVPVYHLSDGWTVTPILAALELKAEQRRPKRDPGHEWWLEWGAEMEPAAKSGAWGLASTPTRHGVTAYQAIWLYRLAGCGFRTRVAYGADEAFEWLSEVCG